ncbi:MAG: hypothetical protein RBT33_04090 [Candidatus Dojkabacteria bacterium]|jgi:hypothetical protein|nr:hypothetical protein [Candidatus Dojkabacteria bacterium]
MLRKEDIVKALELLSEILGDKVEWIVGASSALFVHGLDILPNDIDIIIDIKDFNKGISLLKESLPSDTTYIEEKQKITFEISRVSIDLLAFDISSNDIEYKNIGSTIIPVNSLSNELFFYKQRTDKKDANQRKISLIEEELDRKKS